MSSQKKPTIWQKIKSLLAEKVNRVQSNANPAIESDDSKAADPAAVQVTPSEPQSQPTVLQQAEGNNLQVGNNNEFGTERASVEDTIENSPRPTSEPTEPPTSAKFISAAGLDEADNKRSDTASFQNSEHPITDNILDFLEANDLNYYYHQPAAETQSEEASTVDNGIAKRNVHHISMSMRYYNAEESSAVDDSHSSSDDNGQQPGTEQTAEKEGVEWGCVIRVHEHTQLVAFYGVLPFHLPESHLQAGMVLATQLNYDMMLGCVEIDIRDGEIRFKNSLDLEPIIEDSGGYVPAPVLSYLLKAVMAMTASFAPLFSDLITKDPQEFELDTLLEELSKAQREKSFFLPTEVRQ